MSLRNQRNQSLVFVPLVKLDAHAVKVFRKQTRLAAVVLTFLSRTVGLSVSKCK